MPRIALAVSMVLLAAACGDKSRKPFGAPCTDYTDCISETCLQVIPGDGASGFCSESCESGTNAPCADGLGVCMNSACLPACSSMDECQALGPLFSGCDFPSAWDALGTGPVWDYDGQVCYAGETASERGAEDEPCRVDGSCDAGLACREGICEWTPCVGVSCGGHGTCVLDSEQQALCDCDPGWLGVGAGCADEACNGARFLVLLGGEGVSVSDGDLLLEIDEEVPEIAMALENPQPEFDVELRYEDLSAVPADGPSIYVFFGASNEDWTQRHYGTGVLNEGGLDVGVGLIEQESGDLVPGFSAYGVPGSSVPRGNLRVQCVAQQGFHTLTVTATDDGGASQSVSYPYSDGCARIVIGMVAHLGFDPGQRASVRITELTVASGADANLRSDSFDCDGLVW
ncbi:MAG: hypothetical protein JXR96_00785 [Deltaproteobacteria bacterium]|nr:hypothetical protein [Deltaproteobacteria bacterium]